jgi:hypothetical protein
MRSSLELATRRSTSGKEAALFGAAATGRSRAAPAAGAGAILDAMAYTGGLPDGDRFTPRAGGRESGGCLPLLPAEICGPPNAAAGS